MIGTKYLLTLLILISLILPLQSSLLKFADGQMKTDSILIMYDNNNSTNPFLTDSKNTIIKPMVQVSIEGTPNDDHLKGGEGDDKISGEDGNDTIMGGKGNDMLLGGKGDDGILGDEGNDVLNGGEGVDIMAGGLGNDTFICDQFDTIIDFNLNEGDKIVGQCSLIDLAENETSYDNFTRENLQPGLPPPPASFNSNNLPQQEEEFKMPPPQPQPKLQPKLQSPPSPAAFSRDDMPTEEFGSFPPIPVPPSSEKYFSGPFFN